MNKTSNYQFTIIVPFYNEEENILNLERTLGSYLSVCSRQPACIVFVNDGSTDKGGDRVKEACTRNKDFFYLELKKNGGLSGALKAGIDNCFSPVTGYIDADLQTNPEDFNLLLENIDNYSMVIGIREKRQDSFVKKTSSLIANGFRRMMTKDGISDTGCPLKVMQTSYAKKIPFFTGMHRFLPALFQMAGGSVKQIPVRHYPRQAGVAKYNLWNRLIGPLKDCFAFRWMKKRYIDYQISDTTLK